MLLVGVSVEGDSDGPIESVAEVRGQPSDLLVAQLALTRLIEDVDTD